METTRIQRSRDLPSATDYWKMTSVRNKRPTLTLPEREGISQEIWDVKNVAGLLVKSSATFCMGKTLPRSAGGCKRRDRLLRGDYFFLRIVSVFVVAAFLRSVFGFAAGFFSTLSDTGSFCRLPTRAVRSAAVRRESGVLAGMTR